MDVENRWTLGEMSMEKTNPYQVPTVFDLMSDPNMDMLVKFFSKMWPKPTPPMQQIGELDATYQARVVASQSAWDGWMSNMMVDVIVRKKPINPPFMFSNAPPPHMWILGDNPIERNWPTGCWVLIELCQEGSIPATYNGPNTRIKWDAWLQSPDLATKLIPIMAEIGPYSFSTMNGDFMQVPPNQIWGFGGVMNTIYPDSWNVDLCPPLNKPGGFGQVVGFPDPVLWVSPMIRNTNFPLFTPGVYCPCPDHHNMSIMEKIYNAFQHHNYHPQDGYPIGDPTKWPSDVEMSLFLETFYPKGLQYCGFKDVVHRDFPPAWKTLVMACMVNLVAEEQQTYVFQTWSTPTDPNEPSGFFVGLGEMSPEVKQFFVDNPIDKIEWHGYPPGTQPIWGLSELMNGLNINDIVWTAWQHDKNGDGLFFRPSELPPAAALLQKELVYQGPISPKFHLYFSLPAIYKFFFQFVGSPFASQTKLQDFAMVICLNLIYACQDEISNGKNPWIPPDHINDWTPKYPTGNVEKNSPIVKELGELWKNNYSGSWFKNSYDLFATVDLKGEPKYSLARFMVENPLPMALNPGIWYEAKKWLGWIKTDNERELLLKHQWEAYCEWGVKNVYAKKRADENPNSIPYVEPGGILLDEDGKQILNKEDKVIKNVCPDFGIMDSGTSKTPMIVQILGGLWYQWMGDNLWTYVRQLIAETVKLIFWALDLIGKIIKTVIPSFLLLALGIGVFMIGLTYFEERAKESAEPIGREPPESNEGLGANEGLRTNVGERPANKGWFW